jgi:YVTN family beta-propeller protein
MGNIGPEVSSGGYVSSLALDPTSNRLYLAHLITGEVTALDGTTLATVATFSLPAIPQSVAINPATSRVYTANNNGTLSIIDARTDAVVATVAVQSNPSAVAVDPTLNRVYVANAGSNSVSVIDNPATPPSPTPVATEVPHDGRYFPQTGFRVDDDAVWDYFVHRGGIANFGYPVSRTFRFQGHPVQFFQRRIVELDDNGHPRLLNLLDGGLMPYASFNQAQMPAFDPALVGTAPPTTDAPATLAFVRAHAPDTFAGLPVDFFHTFANTVTPAVAFGPAGGDPSLLPGFNLELWGIPTSAPAFDPHDHNFVYLRFQRGIMMYDAGCACTQGVLLADYLKGILTGQNLPSDLAREAQDSPFFRQYDPGQPNWVHNPELLANSDLTNAFTPE